MLRRRSALQGSLALGLAGASGGARAAEAPVITFGGSVPMSGAQADTGLDVLSGYQVAVKFINERLGGLKVGDATHRLDLAMFDDASDPQRATTLIQKQLDAGVDFFLGSFSSGIVLPTATITERARRPMVQAGGGADAIFTRGLRYVFGMFPRASRQLVPLVELLKTTEPPVRTVAIVTTNDAYSRSQAEAVEAGLRAAGFAVGTVQRLPASVGDVSGVVAAIRNEAPDALICNTHAGDSLLITQQLAATGTDCKLIFEALGPEVDAFRKSLGRDADGLLFLNYWDPREHLSDPFFGSSGAWYDYYRATTDRPYAYQTVAASACIVAYARAMQDAGSTDPQRVRDALAALDLESVYGRIRFTAQGDGDPVAMGAAIGQVQHGGGEVVFPAGKATAKLAYPLPSWSSRG